MGKTRIVLAAGSELLDEYRGGVWLVRAETFLGAEELLSGVAGVLSVRDVPGVDLFDALCARVEGSELMLVLDNLEQIAGAQGFVEDLLSHTTSLRVLVASQTPLHVTGELVVRVEPLGSNHAVELFSLKTREAGVELDFSEKATSDLVARVVEWLGRLPLAIELAAAQMRLFTLTELLDGLQTQLSGNTKLDTPSRQQSLKAMIDWSISALPSQARELFAKLGVFTGITSLEAIEEVCGNDPQTLDAVATLVDFSLLRRTRMGFGMAPTIAQAATNHFERIKQRSRLQEAQATAMINQIGKTQTLGRDSPDALSFQPNFLSAVQWAKAHDVSIYRSLLIKLVQWWWLMGLTRLALEEVSNILAISPGTKAEHTNLLASRAYILHLAGRHEEAITTGKQATRVLEGETSEELGRAYRTLAIIEKGTNPAKTVYWAGKAYDQFSQFENVDNLSSALMHKADGHTLNGSVDEARIVLDQLGALAKTHSNIFTTVGRLNSEGMLALATDQPLRAIEFCARSLYLNSIPQATLYNVCGLIESAFKLQDYKASTELLAAIQTTTKEFGMSLASLGLPQWKDIDRVAKQNLTTEAYQIAHTKGEAVSSGELGVYALAIAKEVLQAHGESIEFLQ